MTHSRFCRDDVFDNYAGDYDSALAEGISISGEDKNYFARGRIAWLASCLQRLQERPKCFLDYGCGTGSASPFIFDVLGVESLIGVDMSSKSLEQATQNHGTEQTRFFPFSQYQPKQEVDIAFCNGVFHHIQPNERAAAVDYIHRSLRPGGLFSFWENNPWNPGTRYVMSRIPFDRDAITLTAREARRILRNGGFTVLRTDYLFVFPRMMRWLRRTEPGLSRLPLGAQYQILCCKQ
jgi:SAM-dependent methyltransferase